MLRECVVRLILLEAPFTLQFSHMHLLWLWDRVSLYGCGVLLAFSAVLVVSGYRRSLIPAAVVHQTSIGGLKDPYQDVSMGSAIVEMCV